MKNVCKDTNLNETASKMLAGARDLRIFGGADAGEQNISEHGKTRAHEFSDTLTTKSHSWLVQ